MALETILAAMTYVIENYTSGSSNFVQLYIKETWNAINFDLVFSKKEKFSSN